MKHKRMIFPIAFLLAVALLCGFAMAAESGGSVAEVVESTWNDAASQIKTVVDSVVFPALDMILAIAFFGKLAMSYFDCAPVAAM